MIVEAIDKRTGRTIRAEDAYSGQRLQCPYCGVDVHPVLGVETPFYRCYEGGKHTNYIYKQLDRTNRVYDPQLTDIEELFDNLFHPVREMEEPLGSLMRTRALLSLKWRTNTCMGMNPSMVQMPIRMNARKMKANLLPSR